MARAGRPRKFKMPRHPNGKIKRDEDQRDTVIAARLRHFGRSEDNPNGIDRTEAGSDLAGYSIGRLALSGSLGSEWRPIVDASNGYVGATARFMRVKYPSYPHPKAMDWISSKGLGGDFQIEEVDRIVARYERYRAILASVDGLSRMKFHEIAFDDVGNSPEHTLAVLKCANAIISGLAKNPKP